MNIAVTIIVFLPVVTVWILALYDVLTRRDISSRRRVVVALALLAVFPLTVLYLLARPPSSVRRGPETSDDPRTALVDVLEAGGTGEDAVRAELAGWVAGVVGSGDDPTYMASSGGADR